MKPSDLDTLLKSLDYVPRVVGTADDGSGDQVLAFVKQLDSSAGSDLQGLELQVAVQADKLVMTSGLFGESRLSKSIPLAALAANTPEAIAEIIGAAERDAWARPDNLARTQTTKEALQHAIAGAFEGDAAAYGLDYLKGEVPADPELAELGFRKLFDTNEQKDYYYRLLDDKLHAQKLVINGDDSAELTLLEHGPSGLAEPLLIDQIVNFSAEDLADRTRKALAGHNIERDALVLQDDPEAGTVDDALRGKASALGFYRVGRDGGDNPSTHYARDLTGGRRQHLLVPDDIEKPFIVETRNDAGVVLSDAKGEALADQVQLPREGKDHDDYVAEKLAASVQQAEAQREAVSEKEKEPVEVVPNEDIHFKRLREPKHDITLTPTVFMQAMHTKLDYATKRAMNDDSLFGAFSRGYQQTRQRIEAAERAKLSKNTIANRLTKEGRELAGLEATLAQEHPGLIIRTLHEEFTPNGISNRPTGVRAAQGSYLGSSERFHLFKLEGRNEALAMPRNRMDLPKDLKIGEQTTVVLDLRTRSAHAERSPADRQVQRNKGPSRDHG